MSLQVGLRGLLLGLAVACVCGCKRQPRPRLLEDLPAPRRAAPGLAAPGTAAPSFAKRRGRVVVSLPLGPQQTGFAVGKVDEIEGRKRLRLRLDRPGLPPLLARYRQTPKALELIPAMKLAAGHRYVAIAGARTAVFQKPAAVATARARVLAVYPSRRVLPANVLKLYVEFSARMQGGAAFFDGVKLFDETAGREVRGPWRRLPLWTRGGRVATILFHPGRVKRGIGIAKEAGAVLHAGRRYRLRITTSVRDAQGRPLIREYVKRFAVVAPDRSSPDPKKWTLHRPTAGTRGPLWLRFDEALDFSLIPEAFRVFDGKGRRIPGVATAGKGELSVRFVPQRPWPLEQLELQVQAKLAMDCAGNSVSRPFDARIGSPFKRDLSLSFRPGPRAR